MMRDENDIPEHRIEEILQRVGPLRSPPEEMTARVKASVKDTWRAEVTANKIAEPLQSSLNSATARSTRSWQLARIAVAFALVAIVSIVSFKGEKDNLQQVAAFDSNYIDLEYSTDNLIWSPIADGAISIHSGSYFRVGQNESVSMLFSDGMNVRAKPNAIFQVENAHSVRLFKGALYLDSYNRPQTEPFTINTLFGQATDIGTQYQVILEEQQWSVQVREGQVEVTDSQQELMVNKGVSLTLFSKNDVSPREPTSRAISPTDSTWQWTEQSRPEYQLDGKVLSEYLMWVARETGKDLQYQSDDVRLKALKTTVHGSIGQLSAQDSLRQVLLSTNLNLIDSAESVIMVGYH